MRKEFLLGKSNLSPIQGKFGVSRGIAKDARRFI